MQKSVTLHDVEVEISDAEIEVEVECDSVTVYKDASGQAEVTLTEETLDQCDRDDIEWLLKVLNEKLKELSESD